MASAASSATRRAAGGAFGRRSTSSRISGAPITHEPWPANVVPLHLRAEENATWVVDRPGRRSAAGTTPAPAWLPSGSVRMPRAPPGRRAARRGAVERLDRLDGELAGRERAGLVDAQHVDPGQAFDRGEFLDDDVVRGPAGGRRGRAARLTSSTRPWGTRPTTPATAATSPSETLLLPRSWLHTSRPASGGSSPADDTQDPVDARCAAPTA